MKAAKGRKFSPITRPLILRYGFSDLLKNIVFPNDNLVVGHQNLILDLDAGQVSRYSSETRA